jgi:iron complex outermembrane recepter protein
LNFYKDGFLVPSGLGGGNLKRQVANLDRIEVLKGPGSVLYGRNEPGGVVNLVTKRPLATPYYSLQQQFGSYDFYRTTADATGPITQDDTLLYRVNLSYENAGSFRDFVETDTVFFAPSLTWNITDRTQANLDIEYQHFDNTNDSGIPPIGNRPAPVSINRQTGEPLNNLTRGDRTYVGAHWSHEFNDDWKLNHRFGAEFTDLTSLFTFYFGGATPLGDLKNLDNGFTNGGVRGFNNGITHQQNYYTTLNLNGKFKTAMLEHNTLWGFDYFVIDNQDFGSCCAAFPIGGDFNIFNPVYQTSLPANNFAPTFDTTQNWYGLYWQDQIKFPFNIYGNVGVRYDNAEGFNNFNGLRTTDDDKVSPRGGLLWQPMKWLALYGNYSENFGVSNSLFRGVGENVAKAQTAEQWELGAKTQFWDGRLSTTFSYFELTKKNVGITDFGRNPPFTHVIGEQESRGYEFELTGELLPGWNVIGAYTHLAYAGINKDGIDGTSDNTGNRMYNTPRHYGSLWSTYEFLSGSLHGLKFGGGMYAASQSQGTNANTFQLPGYVTLNLMTSYGMKIGKSKVTAQLNVNNILDKTYFVGNNSSTMINFGQPLNFMGSLKVEF